jgi:hypothetical protein
MRGLLGSNFKITEESNGDDEMRTISLGIVAALLAVLTCLLTQEVNAKDLAVRHWSIDLNSSAEVKNAGPIDANTRIKVVYLGQNHIAVALLFPIRVNGKWPPVRDQGTWRALLLSVEGASGKIQYSFQFDDFHGEGASPDWLQMGVLNSDELLIIFGNELLRFSSDMVPVVRRTLPREMKVRNGLHYYDQWGFVTNPTQDSALLTHVTVDRSLDESWISTKDLKEIGVAHFGNFHSSSSALFDRRVMFTSSDLNPKKPTTMIETDGQAAKPLGEGTLLASFGQSLLFMHRHKGASHVVINLEGKQIYTRQLGFGSDRILAASGAEQRNRVAFVYGALRASIFGGWSSHDHIVILDTDIKSEVEIPSRADKGVDVGRQVQVFNSPALSLSPDGKALAVVEGSAATLWDLP